MLIETPYKAGDTISVKLASGEEIIARLDSEKDNFLVLHKPLMVVAGAQGLGLAPFMFTVNPETKLNVNVSNTICIAKTDNEMAKQYISSTTGIVT